MVPVVLMVTRVTHARARLGTLEALVQQILTTVLPILAKMEETVLTELTPIHALALLGGKEQTATPHAVTQTHAKTEGTAH